MNEMCLPSPHSFLPPPPQLLLLLGMLVLHGRLLPQQLLGPLVPDHQALVHHPLQPKLDGLVPEKFPREDPHTTTTTTYLLLVWRQEVASITR